ncbi:uncharacterized protein LOC126906633 [Daktulosphaira vitifoliae]|uniref:uncharacterized protein LOC126906633 n=1 Tax=Daktulosphaira vitifoliae TaxID=58002 RepID=UPI0021A9E16D|nr:uncharacterized protein LOC126906633 [Daktulosphaira vitifoliae]
MFSLKLVNFYFFLFSMIFYTKSNRSNKKIIDQLDNLLMYSGWDNLSGLHCITYNNTLYYLSSLIEIPTEHIKGDRKIRALTVYLGCSYAKIMNSIFSVISMATQICEKKIKEENDLINGIIWKEEIINIISKFIIPMVTMMKGAMDALDLLHKRPWVFCVRPYYMANPILGEIEDILDNLNKQTLSCDNEFTILSTLQIIYTFSNKRIFNIVNETKGYCNFFRYDKNYLWEEWSKEYKSLNEQDVKLLFITFLTKKIKAYIKAVIIEKYFNLGFKFDPFTEETFIPTPTEPIEPELEFKGTYEEP